MQFPLRRISALTLLILACGESAWAQSTSAKFTDLTLGDFNATINKRVFHVVEKNHYITPKYRKEPAPSTHLELSLDKTGQEIRLLFPSNALGSGESLLSSQLLKNAITTTYQTNQSQKNDAGTVFSEKPKLELKLAPDAISSKRIKLPGSTQKEAKAQLNSQE